MSDKNLFRISDFNSLVVGKRYIVEVKDSCWGKSNVLYCGRPFKNKRELCFTYGDTVESWRTNWNISACKSNLKVWEVNYDN